MKRILIVDRDQGVHDALRGYFESHHSNWEISFVTSGEAALALLADSRFDVVISDLRMPGVDGAMLLRRVQELHPTTVRIVLTAQMELADGLRAVPVAHQFLTKPCDPVLLRNVIERTTGLLGLFESDNLRRMIGEVRSLPSVPRLYSELQSKLNDPRSGAREIAAVIEQDLAMSAKVLQLVNSAYFGRGRQISSIREAVAHLGFNMIKNLVLTVEVFRSFSDYSPGLRIWIESLQAHSVLTSRIAHRMMPDRQRAEDASMAAMLHDTGKLVIAMQRPQYLKEVLAISRTQNRPMHLVERELSGVTHAEIGGFLLGLWGLPYPIVEAVTSHHDPARIQQLTFDVVGAVYVANILTNEITRGTRGPQVLAEEEIDLGYLESLGVAEQLPEWRAVAARQADIGREQAA